MVDLIPPLLSPVAGCHVPCERGGRLGTGRPESLPAYEPGTLRTVFFLRVVVRVDFFDGADFRGSCICSAFSSLAAGAFDLAVLSTVSLLEVLVDPLLLLADRVRDAVLLAAGLLDFFAGVLLLLAAGLPDFFAGVLLLLAVWLRLGVALSAVLT